MQDLPNFDPGAGVARPDEDPDGVRALFVWKLTQDADGDGIADDVDPDDVDDANASFAGYGSRRR